MLTFNFASGADSEALTKLHGVSMEKFTQIVPEHIGLLGMVEEKRVEGAAYTWEAHGLLYLVIYPEEFSIVQRLVAGQCVPRTVHEIVCVH